MTVNNVLSDHCALLTQSSEERECRPRNPEFLAIQNTLLGRREGSRRDWHKTEKKKLFYRQRSIQR